ncbi:MAG: hypothetical protein AABP62_25680 [Planctomycetota bacterium]
MPRFNCPFGVFCQLFASLFLSPVSDVLLAQEKEPPAKLTEHFELGEVRILFSKIGKDAVAADDSDKSGIPDQVEDVAKQVFAARQLFCETLGFPDPLASERYPGVKFLEVKIRGKALINGGNGLAFDEAQRSALPTDPKGTKAITLTVGNHVVPAKNITPAHETFHLIQYGATYFKNKWLLEGMTRWSEHGLAKDGLGEVKYDPKGPWPQGSNDRQSLFKMSYDAEFMLWNPIAKKDDRRGTLPIGKIPKELKNLKYSNGSPVLQDLEFVGAELMREIQLELGQIDDVAFKELGYESWTEANQGSEKNGPYIYQAVMDVLRRRKHQVGKFGANE